MAELKHNVNIDEQCSLIVLRIVTDSRKKLIEFLESLESWWSFRSFFRPSSSVFRRAIKSASLESSDSFGIGPHTQTVRSINPFGTEMISIIMLVAFTAVEQPLAWLPRNLNGLAMHFFGFESLFLSAARESLAEQHFRWFVTSR